MDIPTPEEQVREQKQGVGPLVGIIIVVGLFVIGGIYFLVMQEQNRTHAPVNTGEQASS